MSRPAASVRFDAIDEDAVARRAIELLRDAAPLPLTDRPDRSPGAYGVEIHGRHDLYRPPPQGQLLYVGSGQDLRDRHGRHRISLESVDGLDPDRIRIRCLLTPSSATALLVERLLIARLRPVWNEPWLSGFGSRQQGRTRTAGQRRTAWDVLHPGRHWAAQMDDGDRDLLTQRVRAFMTSRRRGSASTFGRRPSLGSGLPAATGTHPRTRC